MEVRRARSYCTTWPRWVYLGRWLRRLQRGTGVLLVVFAVWHIVRFTGASRDPSRMAGMLTILYNRVIMLIIVACIVPHAINGLRLILLDFRVGEGNQRVAAWMALCVAVAILIVVGWMILW